MKILKGDSIGEIAKSFASILAASRELAQFNSARGKLEQDKEAQSLLAEFQKKQQELLGARMRGRSFTGDELKAIQALQLKVQSNPVIMEFARSQQEAAGLIKEINIEISGAAGFNFGQSSSGGGSC